MANSASAGVGLLAVMVGIPSLVGSAIRRGDQWSLVGIVIFALSMVSLYLASTIYHAVPQGKTKEFFHLLDHSAIYVLIAGTYTPFALGALRGVWGWTLFGVVWTLAVLGICFKVFGG
jgi:hemolysin III